MAVFQHCGYTVGGEILTFPDTPTTQGLSLWCFNTVLYRDAHTSTRPKAEPGILAHHLDYISIMIGIMIPPWVTP